MPTNSDKRCRGGIAIQFTPQRRVHLLFFKWFHQMCCYQKTQKHIIKIIRNLSLRHLHHYFTIIFWRLSWNNFQGLVSRPDLRQIKARDHLGEPTLWSWSKMFHFGMICLCFPRKTHGSSHTKRLWPFPTAIGLSIARWPQRPLATAAWQRLPRTATEQRKD